jgi:TrmH family RNA methyltransferase
MDHLTEAPDDMTGPDLVVVLAGPKTPGNVGAVARVMSNFQVDELRIVEGVPFEEDTYKRALHARGILENARRFDDFKSALDGLDFTAATTGITNLNDKRHLRNPLTPRALHERISNMEGRVGLVFGREDFGLYNDELALCDIVVTVPTSPEYPVMNLSHAVAVILYEIRRDYALAHDTIKASQEERDRLLEAYDELMEVTDYPPHKLVATRVMIRRIIGRSTLSEWEYHTMMGIVRRATKRIERLEERSGKAWDDEENED